MGISRVAIVGLGLIGGSLLRRLPAEQTVGFDLDPATRAAAAAAGHTVAGSITAAVGSAELVVVAVPLPALPGVLAGVGAAAAPGTLLTDVTSVKGPVADWVRGPVRFVGGHPMAGTERSGFAAADPDLFNGAAWVLTLTDRTDPAAWLELAARWCALGARIVPATPAEHDHAVAAISHLPHLLAATLAGQADQPLALGLAAGSFRDGSRVAGTRPELSTAMCRGNAAALRPVLDRAIATLQAARADLTGDILPELFATGHRVRAGWPATGTVGLDLDLDPAADDLVEQLLALGRAGGWVQEVTATGLHARRPAH